MMKPLSRTSSMIFLNIPSGILAGKIEDLRFFSHAEEKRSIFAGKVGSRMVLNGSDVKINIKNSNFFSEIFFRIKDSLKLSFCEN